MSDIENPNEKQESKPKILIGNVNLPSGVYSCLHNSAKFLKTSKLLFDNEDYQAVIPVATISIEESMKGLELLRRFSYNQDVTVGIWKKLTTHKHKLTQEMEWGKRVLENASDDDIEKAKDEAVKINSQINAASIDTAIKTLQRKSDIYAHLQKLREGCFYSDWDKLRKKWTVFDEMSKEKQEALSFFVYVSAQIDVDFLKTAVERYANRLRETQQLLGKSPYSYYEEFRPTEKWNSRGPDQILHDAGRTKFAKGVEVMDQFIALQSFPLLSFNVFRECMYKYLKIVVKREDEKRFPHPMIKAMVMAASTAQEKNKEGENIAVRSEDEEQVYGRKLKIMFAVVVKMKAGVCKLVRIADMDNPEIEFTQDMIEKIIRTETIMERNQGDWMPNNVYAEAFNVIGIETKMIKLEEIPEVICFAKKMARFEQGKRVSEETISQINAIKGVEEWDSLSTALRSRIVSDYGQKKYPKYRIHMLQGDSIQKFVCRKMLLVALKKLYLSTA